MSAQRDRNLLDARRNYIAARDTLDALLSDKHPFTEALQMIVAQVAKWKDECARQLNLAVRAHRGACGGCTQLGDVEVCTWLPN